MSVYQLANGRWRCQIRRKSFQFDDHFDTEEEARQAQAVADGLTGGITLQQFVNVYYLPGSAYTEMAPLSREAYDDRLAHILPLIGSFTLASLSVATLETYKRLRREKAAREEKPLSVATLQTELNVISAVLTFAVTTKVLPANPVLPGLQQARGKRTARRGRTTAETKARLLDAAEGRDVDLPPYKNGRVRKLNAMDREAARFMHLVTVLGCRVKEISKLEPGHINLADLLYFSILKGNKPTWRVLPEALLPVIKTQWVLAKSKRNKYPYLFSTNGGPFRGRNAATRLIRIGLVPPGWRPHMRRHDFVSAGIDSGIPPQDIIAATGHSSVLSLEWYSDPEKDNPGARARQREMMDQRLRDIKAMSSLKEIGVLPTAEDNPWDQVFNLSPQ